MKDFRNSFTKAVTFAVGMVALFCLAVMGWAALAAWVVGRQEQ